VSKIKFKQFIIIFLISIFSGLNYVYSQEDVKKNLSNDIAPQDNSYEKRPDNAPRSDKHRNTKDALGRKQGLWKYYTSEGILLLEISFQNDIKHGSLVRHHSSNGVVTEESFYFNGKRDGDYKRYTYKGLLITEGFYTMGKKTGLWICYFPVNGEKRSEGNYANGKKIGLWRYYSAKGKLKSEGEYKDGNMDGEWKYYDNDGTPTENKKFTKGILADDSAGVSGKNTKGVKVKTAKNSNSKSVGSTPKKP